MREIPAQLTSLLIKKAGALRSSEPVDTHHDGNRNALP